MIKRLLDSILREREQKRRTELNLNLIRHEAKIGGQVFGPVPKGHRREFFCLDRHTWVWHEEWIDTSGARQIQTTRYDVRPGSVFKSQNGQYKKVSNSELKRLQEAAF